MTIARADLWDNLCPVELSDTTLNFTLFDYVPHPLVLNLTLLYGCLPNASYDHVQERGHFQWPEVAVSQSSKDPYDLYIPEWECKSRIKAPVFQEGLYAFWGDEHDCGRIGEAGI
ncbi:hypothetical protein HYC85_030696 [Camellia sinensis]|uniref:Uncharacterized protein n=1 Tax=Camellia sinensis TaxID=4442 RepID=A0A7J7G2I5_CAMSI|nr:hypothetical protein HYC85_030696 [Camellia sinensis]